MTPGDTLAYSRHIPHEHAPADSLGARIAAARVARGLRQRDLAALIGVSQAAVCRWESDRDEPGWPVRAHLATLLDLPELLVADLPQAAQEWAAAALP